MSSGTSRGPYAKTASVRARIVEACGSVLAETGYHGLLVKDVAERAGISPRGLVHHFANRDELLAAVLEALEEREGQSAPSGGDPQGIAHVIDDSLTNRHVPGVVDLIITLSAAATTPDHPAHDYFSRRFKGLRGYLVLAFDTLRQERRLRTETDSVTLANMLMALFDGLNLQWLYHRDQVNMARALDAFLSMIGADLRPATLNAELDSSEFTV